MKKLLGFVVLFASLSAMASDFYIDCRMPGEYTEGFSATSTISLDAKMVANNQSKDICVRLTRTITSKACTYSHCDVNTMVDSSVVEVCNQNIDEMKAEIVSRLCVNAEAASINDGVRPVKKEESRTKPEEC